MELLTFGTLAIILYFKVPPKCQWKLILIINIILYICFAGYVAFFYLLIVAFITFVIAIKIENIDKIGKDLLIVTEDYQTRRIIRESISNVKKYYV